MLPSILVVDDNPAMIQLVATMLADTARIRFATSGAKALEQVRSMRPDLVLLDAEMPGMDGFELCTALKADPALVDLPVIFVTAHDAVEFELRGLEAGAVDFISKPISQPLLLARVRTQLRIKGLTDELRRLACFDGLTGVANRRTFEEQLETEWLRARRTGTAISVVMLDVDHFKLFNDHYGHPAGDACLRRVAEALRGAASRPADLVARYGGEEFALLLPETPIEGAEHVARAATEAVARLRLEHACSSASAHVSVSAGVGCASAREMAARPLPDARLRLVRAADEALYAAKRAGRDRAWSLGMGELEVPAAARPIAPVLVDAGTA